MGRAFGSLGATDPTDSYRFILPTGDRHFTVGEWRGLRDHTPEQLRNEYARGTLPTIPSAKGDVRKDKELLALYGLDIHTAGYFFGNADTQLAARQYLGNDADFPEVLLARLDETIAYAMTTHATTDAEVKKTEKAYSAAMERTRVARENQYQTMMARRLAKVQAARQPAAPTGRFFRLPDGRTIPLKLYDTLTGMSDEGLVAAYNRERNNPNSALGRFASIIDDEEFLQLVSAGRRAAYIAFGTATMRNEALSKLQTESARIRFLNERFVKLFLLQHMASLQAELTRMEGNDDAEYERRATTYARERVVLGNKLDRQQAARAATREPPAVADQPLDMNEVERLLQEVEEEQRRRDPLTPAAIPEDKRAEYQEWLRLFNEKGDFKPGTYDYNKCVNTRMNYLGTLVGWKPDPLGRFPLMDVFSNGSVTALTLSGAAKDDKQVLLAGVYLGIETYSYRGQEYRRQHGLPGARVLYQGWGAAAYMASAWMVGVLYDNAGTASHVNSRTADADAVWNSMLNHGTTLRIQEKEKSTTEKRICLPVPRAQVGWKARAFDLTDQSGTIVSDEVCGPAKVEYEVDGRVVDYLKRSALRDENLLVWSIYDGLPGLAFDMDWRWNGKSDDSKTPNRLRELPEKAKSTLPMSRRLDAKQAERLARAYHGSSVNLILTIANRLLEDNYKELAKQYLLRADVAQIAGSDPKYIELVNSGQLSSVIGLSGLGDVEALHQAASRGKLHIDWSSENPLHLPKLSAATKKAVDEFPDF